MPKQNFLSGIKTAYDPVGARFTRNTDYPYFDHFVYQQIIDDGIQANYKLRLPFYAINAAFKSAFL
jgi:hypothetical protein